MSERRESTGSPIPITYADHMRDSNQEALAKELEAAIIKHPGAKNLKPERVQKHVNTLLEGISFTELLAVALDTPAKQRCKKLPSCFKKDGKLLVPWLYAYDKKISQARVERKELEFPREILGSESSNLRGRSSKRQRPERGREKSWLASLQTYKDDSASANDWKARREESWLASLQT